MHFYFIFEEGDYTRCCADWPEARRVGLDAADDRRSRVVNTAWKSDGELERWAKIDEQWAQVLEDWEMPVD